MNIKLLLVTSYDTSLDLEWKLQLSCHVTLKKSIPKPHDFPISYFVRVFHSRNGIRQHLNIIILVECKENLAFV